MTVGRIHKAYMIGIGGIGMSAIARYLNSIGVKVEGYDKTPSPITEALQEEGVEVFFTENVNRIPKEVDVIIYTPAIPDTHAELTYYREHKYNVLKRSEMLGRITLEGDCYAVAGSHGKSTTSAMLAHILKEGDTDCTAFLGAIANNFNSNYLQGHSHSFVVEADEYDRSFHQLFPKHAIITSVDSDHLDIYGTMEGVTEAFKKFVTQIDKGGKVIIPAKESFKSLLPENQVITYSVNEPADYTAKRLQIVDNHYQFDLETPAGTIQDIELNMGGRHNIENAIAAIALAHHLGLKLEVIKQALASFTGIKRRFEFVLKEDNITYIDDYAHHPKEIEAFIDGVRELYPTQKITGIFQPHLFSRTRDYYKGFANTLSALDKVILMDVYPAREEPIPNVSSQLILDALDVEQKAILSPHQIVDTIASYDSDIVVSIGAGDIGLLVEPIKRELLNLRTAEA